MNTDNTHSDDLTILAALEALERGIDSPRGPRADETTETLTRLYTEVLGLVPFETEPVTPSAGSKARLMALIQGGETPPAAEPAAAPARAVAPAPVAPLRPAQETRAPRPATGSYAVSRRGSRWPLALAAALALALLGLSLWLFTQVGTLRETIARLEDEVKTERARAAAAEAEVERVKSDSLDLRQKFQLVTSHAVEVSPMRPVGEAPLQPNASGILFVAADHQHWYLRVRNLQPAVQGKTYTLWFETPQGPVRSGHFSGKTGEPEDLSSETMPVGTNGVLVTLEDSTDVAAPTGPPVLRAAAVYPIT
ncbi:MAG TPA: anti-sigma factor [Thermoanaerobaculia bacterium]